MKSSDSLFLLTRGCLLNISTPSEVEVDGTGGIPLNIIIASFPMFFHGISAEVQLYRGCSEGYGCGKGNPGGLKRNLKSFWDTCIFKLNATHLFEGKSLFVNILILFY